MDCVIYERGNIVCLCLTIEIKSSVRVIGRYACTSISLELSQESGVALKHGIEEKGVKNMHFHVVMVI